MSLFSGKEEDVVLFSPLEGTLTFQGKPAAGAKITRKVSWKDDVGETDVFYADDKGHFSLPLKSAHLKLSAVSQLVINQDVSVQFNNSDHLIWTMGKGAKTLFGELGGKPLGVSCELTGDLVRVDVPDGLLGTSCKWETLDLEKKHG